LKRNIYHKMQQFTNNIIESNELPKFEDVKLKALQSKYFRVIMFNLCAIFIVIILVFLILVYLKETIFSNRILLISGFLIPILFGFFVFLSKLSFHKKGYAFREHDFIYKSGLISETTTIIPFNRVQHVALHQGFISRKLRLAAVELFTAGGESSDLKIPGLLLEEAQKIKNLISQKINPLKDDFESNENLISETNE
jgi:membrane protein YdbS with pleckstrin-like domain